MIRHIFDRYLVGPMQPATVGIFSFAFTILVIAARSGQTIA